MDTNIVRPLGPESCEVIFDYWVDEELAHNTAYIEDSLASSHQASYMHSSCRTGPPGPDCWAAVPHACACVMLLVRAGAAGG